MHMHSSNCYVCVFFFSSRTIEEMNEKKNESRNAINSDVFHEINIPHKALTSFEHNRLTILHFFYNRFLPFNIIRYFSFATIRLYYYLFGFHKTVGW